MDLFGWPWAWQVAGQSLACSAFGVWASYRLERSPARGHAAVLMALSGAVLAPTATLVMSGLGWGLLEGPAPAEVYRLAGAGPTLPSPEAWDWVASALLAVWAAVTSCHLAGLAVALWRGGRLVARSEEVRDPWLLAALESARSTVGLRREVRLRSSAEVACPAVWAWEASPVVLIPDQAAALPGRVDWEAVFVHELAHVARRDHLAGLLASIAAACLFWNPVIWWARRRLERASEYACDDRVAAVRSPVDYAASLLALRRAALAGSGAALALGGREGILKARLQRLLDGSPGAKVGRGWAAAAAGLTGLAVLTLAAAQARPGPRPPEGPANFFVSPSPGRP